MSNAIGIENSPNFYFLHSNCCYSAPFSFYLLFFLVQFGNFENLFFLSTSYFEHYNWLNNNKYFGSIHYLSNVGENFAFFLSLSLFSQASKRKFERFFTDYDENSHFFQLIFKNCDVSLVFGHRASKPRNLEKKISK